MADALKEAEFSEARIDQVRSDAKTLMEREGLSRAKAARDLGVGESTLSAWLTGSYNGRNSQVAMDVQRWITARLQRAATAARQPAGPGYVQTRTSAAIAALLEHAQYAPDFALVLGDPGLGKTTTAHAYQRTAHNVWMITCQPTTGSANMVVADVAEALAVGHPGVTAPRLSKLIGKFLTGRDALLIVDEAQNLNSTALDQLRSFYDLAQCGLVLMGNRSILRALEGGSRRSADFAQLYSRVGQRLDRRKPAADDIEQILTAWGIEDQAVRRVARAVARKPGALRTMNKVLRQAHQRARLDDGPVTELHMIQSAAQLGDEKPLELDA